MDAYEKEMYDFLTRPENFENMVKVFNLKDMVRRNLVLDFWGRVLEILGELNKEHGDKWKIRPPLGDYFARWDSIVIYKESWVNEVEGSPILVSWESLSNFIHYGVWINPDSKVVDVGRIRRHFEPIRKKQGVSFNNYWLLLSNYQDYNFENFAHLKHILPDSKAATADEFARLIFGLAEELEKDLDEAMTMKLLAPSPV